MFKLKITRVRCYGQEDWTGDDDIQLSVGGEQVWRGDMNDSDKSEVAIGESEGVHYFDESIQLEMCERDEFDGNDAIRSGQNTIQPCDSAGVESVISFSGDGAVYNVWYVVSAECDEGAESGGVATGPGESGVAPSTGGSAVGAAVVACPLAQLTVVVVTEEGRPIANISVSVVRRGGREYGTTDAEGMATFSALESGGYAVEVYWPREASQVWTHELSLSAGEDKALLARVVTGGSNPHPTGEEIIAISRSATTGGGYDSSPSDNKGAPEPVYHDGVCILGGRTDVGTYCCAVTFWAAMKALDRYELISDRSTAEIKTFKDQWYGRKGVDLNKPLLADALPNLGVGTIVAHDDAQPGDFCQFWRTNKKGHSVVFLGWERAKDDSIIGLRYWSSQEMETNGIGERKEYFSDSGVADGKIDQSLTFFGRITPVSKIVVFEELDAVVEYPIGESDGEEHSE